MAKISNEQREMLIQGANQIRSRAYAPYSKYPVGAALLSSSGTVYYGVNVENAAYPLCMCAERTAIFNAVSAGETDFLAIAVATRNGGMPCGSCRQVLAEFGKDIRVFIVKGETASVVEETTVSELLPGAFTGKDLDE
jgi:cytidine deaminase